jgi:phosphoglycolate phosphatase
VDAVYLDLDGTLLGPGGALVHGAGGRWSLDGLRALDACRRARAEVVLMSGRPRRTLGENARLLALGDHLAEAGSIAVLDGEAHWLTGDLRPDGARGSVFEQIAASGAPDLLLTHFAGRLEPHTPWVDGREVSHLLRGLVDTGEADALLRDHGHRGLRLVDNGAAHHRSPTLAGLPAVRVYHLLPRTASKAAAVRFHVAARGHDPAACLAVGDAREDLAVAPHVGHCWLVANGIRQDPGLGAAAAAHANARIASATYGAGVLEAVTSVIDG